MIDSTVLRGKKSKQGQVSPSFPKTVITSTCSFVKNSKKTKKQIYLIYVSNRQKLKKQTCHNELRNGPKKH